MKLLPYFDNFAEGVSITRDEIAEMPLEWQWRLARVLNDYPTMLARYRKEQKLEGYRKSHEVRINELETVHEDFCNGSMIDLEDDDGFVDGRCCSDCDFIIYFEPQDGEVVYDGEPAPLKPAREAVLAVFGRARTRKAFTFAELLRRSKLSEEDAMAAVEKLKDDGDVDVDGRLPNRSTVVKRAEP